MPTATLTVNLPVEQIEFLKAYARKHGLSVAEVMGRYLERLETGTQPAIHPEVAAITGLVPSDANAQDDYRRHLRNKHR
jgi:hypothetical protein